MKLEWWFFEGESSPALIKSEWSILIQIHGDRENYEINLLGGDWKCGLTMVDITN